MTSGLRRMLVRVGLGLAMVTATLTVADRARAEISYQWVFDKDLYVVNPGEKVDVKVYLEEKVGAGDKSLLNAADGLGMFSMGLGVFFGDDPQPLEPAKVLTVADIAHNPAFIDLPRKSVFSTYAILVEPTTDVPVFGELFADNTYRLWAGTFSFTAGSIAGEVTPLRASDNDEVQDDTWPFPLDRDQIDQLIGDGVARIQTVPEPSSLVLIGIAGVCLGGWHLRRRRS